MNYLFLNVVFLDKYSIEINKIKGKCKYKTKVRFILDFLKNVLYNENVIIRR